MNSKTDWLVRATLVTIVFLLAMHLLILTVYPVGRYAAVGSERLLDTKTGTIYVPHEGKIIVANLVELSKRQQETKE